VPSETLDVNGVLNLQAGTVQGYSNVEAANKSNTYAVFAAAGSGGDDWAFLRQIGVTNQYHMALDLHDDANDGKFSIRNVASAGTGTDTVRTLFKVDGSNNRVGIMTDDPQYTLDVEGDLRVTGSMSTIGDMAVKNMNVAVNMNVLGSATLGSLLGCAVQTESWTWASGTQPVATGYYIKLGGLLIRWSDTYGCSPQGVSGLGNFVTFSGPSFANSSYVAFGSSDTGGGLNIEVNARNVDSIDVGGTVNYAFAIMCIGPG
jgi:hypothetical protein